LRFPRCFYKKKENIERKEFSYFIRIEEIALEKREKEKIFGGKSFDLSTCRGRASQRREWFLE
jgi:hypothetical protein